MNFRNNWLQKLLVSLVLSLTILTTFLANLNLPVNSFGANSTDSISIRQTKKDNNLILDYYILQTFKSPSRGIFLTLPKNQDGVWTDYQINQVRRTQKLPYLEINFQQSLLATKQNQKYELIKEWNQLRLRIGEMDKFLENGSYLYHIQLQFPISNYKQDLTLLQDWQDPVTNLEVQVNNQIYCSKTQS